MVFGVWFRALRKVHSAPTMWLAGCIKSLLIHGLLTRYTFEDSNDKIRLVTKMEVEKSSIQGVGLHRNGIVSISQTMCSLPIRVGPCRDNLTRYYFDWETATCRTFVFGGCDGNANNFPTLADCNASCQLG
ncbi:kunitz-type protease inhibitor 3 [Plakobranchus ocellatus]|uniref:Kunitz-type protease inhibitor 3 n=1 Tax=Plakobranchus ocellatus TaxID=259542 RepID=A0AAV3YUQ0_9GAST|nr:kunitz-type protease inhibitor 3 [Plakobranchus ocellatus]